MLLLSLLVVPALFRLSAARGFVCPLEDIERTKCMGPKDCLYPHPTRCDKFIHCDVNTDGVTGRPTINDCPTGFKWNDNAKECDWPENSTCPARHNVVTTVNDVLKETSEILPRGDDVENKVRDTAPFQCPISDMAITQCRGEKDCVYANPGSCNTYIQCSLGSNFLPSAPAVKNCLPGHEWNDKDKKCDVPEKSTCPVYANMKTPVIGDVVEVAGSRRARQIMRCPPSFEWDDKTKSCHLADAVTPIIDEVEDVVEAPIMRCPPGFELNDKECRRVNYANARSPVIDEVEGVVDHAEKKIRQAPRFHCPNEDIIRTKCLRPKDCLYPNPESCFSFIQCMVDPGERSGTPIVIPCPSGFEWNDNAKMCDSPENSTCPRETLVEAIGGAVIEVLPVPGKRSAAGRLTRRARSS